MEKKRRISIKAILVFMMVLYKYLSFYPIFNMKIVYGYLFVLFLMIFFQIFHLKIEKKDLLRMVILLIPIVFVTVIAKDINLLMPFAVALLFYKQDMRKFVKIFLISSIFLFIVTITLNIIGVLPSNNITRWSNGIIKIRYSLGFDHPNNVFLLYLPIVFAAYYIYGGSLKYVLAIFLSATILYKISDSRTGYYLVLFFLLIITFLEKKAVYGIRKTLIFIFPIFTIISYLFIKNYGIDFNNPINQILSFRPYYMLYYIQQGIFSLFGKPLVVGYPIDNMYIFIVSNLGILTFFIYVYIHYKSISLLKHDSRILLIIFFYLLYGLFETNTILASTNFALTIMLHAMITRSSRKKVMVCEK